MTFFNRKSIPGEPGKDYPIFSIDILRKINPGMFGRSAGGSAAAKSGPASKPAAALAPQVSLFIFNLCG